MSCRQPTNGQKIVDYGKVFKNTDVKWRVSVSLVCLRRSSTSFVSRYPCDWYTGRQILLFQFFTACYDSLKSCDTFEVRCVRSLQNVLLDRDGSPLTKSEQGETWRLCLYPLFTCIVICLVLQTIPGIKKDGSCVFCAPLDRCIGRYIDRYVGRVSADISTYTRPMYRSIYRPTLDRHIDRDMSVDMSIDRSVEISVEYRSICRPRYRPSIGRYVGQHSTDTLIIDCRWSIGRLSVAYRSTVVYCIIIRHQIF